MIVSTGDCTDIREVADGVYERVSGACDRVEQLLATRPARDWADLVAAAWFEADRPRARGLTGCSLDPWTPRQRCPHCLADLLRRIVAGDSAFTRGARD
jgi:hypothetical protein